MTWIWILGSVSIVIGLVSSARNASDRRSRANIEAGVRSALGISETPPTVRTSDAKPAVPTSVQSAWAEWDRKAREEKK